VRRTFAVLPGLIGSGETVIADRESPIRRYLTEFNSEVLAVETEAAGVASAFYEYAANSPEAVGWLAIRGISDRADAAKNDDFQQLAAWHAAHVFARMLPYLLPLGQSAPLGSGLDE
jgi:adenosylhomocysteine nucleosidase